MTHPTCIQVNSSRCTVFYMLFYISTQSTVLVSTLKYSRTDICIVCMCTEHGGIKMERPGGSTWIHPWWGIRCVHYIEEKDYTARFATEGILKIPDLKLSRYTPATQAGA